MSTINTLAPAVPPVICNFGWYSGTPAQRLGDRIYRVGTSTYPPGYTTVGTGGVTLPHSTVPSAITVLSQLQELFVASGTIVLDTGNGRTRTTVQYAGLGTLSGSPSSGVQGFVGCTGGTGTFIADSQIYDPRDYVDSVPVGSQVTFDALDSQNLGLPAVTLPSGVSVVAYLWDLGNGIIGRGPQIATTYIYSSFPALRVRLTVIDSLGRRFSSARSIFIHDIIPPVTERATVSFAGGINRSSGRHLSGVLFPGLNRYPSPNLYPNKGGVSFAGSLATVKSGP